MSIDQCIYTFMCIMLCSSLFVQSTVKMLPFWWMYFGELCIGAALSLYVANYLFGRTRNSQIAHSWFVTVQTFYNAVFFSRLTNQMSILKNNFTIVGK